MTRLNAIVAAGIGGIYVAAIALGLHMKSVDVFWRAPQMTRAWSWRGAAADGIPEGAKGESVRRGMRIFEETALYAPEYTRSKVSCGSCHAAAGQQPSAVPLVGAPRWFPMYSKRAGHEISLEDRVEECFVRSENGRPLPYDSAEMKAIVDYIEWLSTPVTVKATARATKESRGLKLLPEMAADPKRGAAVYAVQCAGCHREDGQGVRPMYPPVWGPESFNDGAGMDQVQKLASFVQRNMPQNRMGILTPQEAYDVAAFIHAQSRPKFNAAYAGY